MTIRVLWIEEDDMYMEIARSIGTSTCSLVDPHHDAAKASGKIRTRDGERGKEYHLPDLRKWSKDQQQPRGKKRGGPEPKWDWLAPTREVMARYINNPESFPDKLTGVEHALRNWFIDDGDDCPAGSLIRIHAKAIIDAVKAGKADN